MKLRTQKLLFFLIIGKLVIGFICLYEVGIDSFFMESYAIASELKNDPWQAEKYDVDIAEKESNDRNLQVIRKAELKEEQKRLAKKKAELLGIQEDITNKIAILEQLRDEIRSEMAGKKAFEKQKLKHIIKVFSAMKPQSAAKLIEKLEPELSIELLSNMKGDIVGSILSFLNVEKAAKLSEGLIR